MIQFDFVPKAASIIKVIGVGGGGGNAVSYMHSLGIEGVDFILANTDAKALQDSNVPTKIQLGPNLTEGLGAGANPEVGANACMESTEEITKLLSENTKMVFVTAGMGGGTGTGAAPVIANIAKSMGLLTVGIVTTPFSHEGIRRRRQAEEGIAKMRDNVDTILVISNDKMRHAFGNLPFTQAFAKADNVLATAAKCITDVIGSRGQVGIDFADVCTVMKDGGVAIMGSASSSGPDRAREAVQMAIDSPLLNDSQINGAKWVLVNINSSRGEFEQTVDEIDAIQSYIQQEAGTECDVILGLGIDENLGEAINVTIIATGFQTKSTTAAYDKAHTEKPEDEKIVVSLGNTTSSAAAPSNDTNPTATAVTEIVRATASDDVIIHQLAPSEVNEVVAILEQPKQESIVPSIQMENIEPKVVFSLDDNSIATASIAAPNSTVAPLSEIKENNLLEANAIASPVAMVESTPEVTPVPEVALPIAAETTINNETSREIEVPASNEVIADLPKIAPIAELPIVENILPTTPVAATPIADAPKMMGFGFRPKMVAKPMQEAPTQPQELAIDEQKVVFELSTEITEVPTPKVELEPQSITQESNGFQARQVADDDIVVIQGITINRRRGSRLMTDEELMEQVEFELRKQATYERASSLRSMNFNNGIGGNLDEPAFKRAGRPLPEAENARDEMSNIQIGANSGIETRVAFLNKNNPC